jgi:surface polysaccharide O-acyltransferase-like enzyme
VTNPPAPATGRELYLDALRIAAVCGVVAIHVFAGLMTNPDVRGTARWWGAVVFDAGNVWVVPIFVMVSGALLLGDRAHAGGPAVFYRKRLLRLGPAFVFWQVFYIVVARAWISGQEISPGGVLTLIADGNTYTHLYFLWLIVGLYAIAPVIHPFLSQGTRRRALVMAGVIMSLTVLAYTTAAVISRFGEPRSVTLTAFTQWVPYVGFFVAGIALHGVVLRRGRAAAVGAIGALVLVAIILEYALVPPGSVVRAILPLGYPTLLTSIAVVCIFLTAQHLLAGRQLTPAWARFVRTLSDAAFGVFLVHFVLMLLFRLIPGVADAQRTTFWGAALVWFVVVVASFAISIVARRIPFVRRVF